MLHIASNWQEWEGGADKTIVIYSNCDKVALSVNGAFLVEQDPDKQPYSSYLTNPPFTFRLPNDLEVRAIHAAGAINGEVVAQDSLTRPHEPVRLKMRVDLQDREFESEQHDIVFVHALCTDANGSLVNDSREINFYLEGPGVIIGRNPAPARAGIASVLVKSTGEEGPVHITAKADGLIEAQATIAPQFNVSSQPEITTAH